MQGALAATMGLVFGVVAHVGHLADGLDRWMYDRVARKANPVLPELTLVHTDADAPLSASQHAALIDRLAAAGAKTIVYATPLPATSTPAGMDALTSSLQRAGNVLLALPQTTGAAPQPWPHWMLRWTSEPRPALINAPATLHPLPQPYAQQAAGIGHHQPWTDADGVTRRLPLLLGQDDQAVPALALVAAMHSLHLGTTHLHPDDDGRAMQWPGAHLPTDASWVLRPHLDGVSRQAWPTLTSAEVLQSRPGTDTQLRNQLVVVGAGAPVLRGPGAQPLSAPQWMAHAITSVRQGQSFYRPAGAIGALLALAMACTAYLALVLPRWRTGEGAFYSALITLLIAGASWALLGTTHMWIPVASVVAGMLMGQLSLLGFRLASPKAKTWSPEALESERLMGLAMFGQGRLDEAFAHWKPLPTHPQLTEHLHALGKRHSRLRQYDSAKAVYRHLLQRNPEDQDALRRYRRARKKLQRLTAQPTTTLDVPPPIVAHAPPPPRAEKLGRYVLDGPLGQGAMGLVYRAHAPETPQNPVAIKTMALSHEFEGQGLIEAKDRFMREAEAAGRLQHPAIVQILEAGEDRSLAYIAMEFLPGHDLSAHIQPASLLPAAQVVSIALRVAQALDYAHAHQVVHRDIKPSNIMWDADTDAVKVTDFGVARITDANKTRTGLVLGTPSFMSPEQLAGKRIDGRSDLYSLGVTLYQLLAGQLPFQAPSLPELMYKITHSEPENICQIRPELPEILANTLKKALHKRPEDRFQTGQQLADALQPCLHALHQSGHLSTSAVDYDAQRKIPTTEMADAQDTLPYLPTQPMQYAPHSL